VRVELAEIRIRRDDDVLEAIGGVEGRAAARGRGGVHVNGIHRSAIFREGKARVRAADRFPRK
jgi:hypothetical protein